jgi:hypothetical protein
MTGAMNLAINTLRTMFSLVHQQVIIGDKLVEQLKGDVHPEVILNMILHVVVISGSQCGTLSAILAMKTDGLQLWNAIQFQILKLKLFIHVHPKQRPLFAILWKKILLISNVILIA